MSALPLIVAIEGNIGAGKTTIFDKLKERLSTHPEVVFMPEPVDIWESIVDAKGETVLAKFYRDPVKYAFSFQVMAYSTRLAMLRKTIRENPGCSTIICERSLEADRNIFAKMLRSSGKMEEVEFQIYEMLYHDTASEFPLHRVVYIDAEPSKCLERIGKRARNGESSIPLDYLIQCREYYDDWLLASGRSNFKDLRSPTDVVNPQFSPKVPSAGDTQSRAKILHLNTNPDATYTGENGDLGKGWIDRICDFIQEDVAIFGTP